MIKKTPADTLKYLIFILSVFIYKASFAQNYKTPIPDNGNIVSIYNWLITTPIPSIET